MKLALLSGLLIAAILVTAAIGDEPAPATTTPAATDNAPKSAAADPAVRIKELQATIAALETRLAELRQELARVEADLAAAGGDPAAAMLGVTVQADKGAESPEQKPVLLADIIAAGWKAIRAAPEPNQDTTEAQRYRDSQASLPFVGRRLIMRGAIGFAGPDMRPGARTNDNQQPYAVCVDYASGRKVDTEASPNRKTLVPAETVSIAFVGLAEDVLGLKQGTTVTADAVIKSVRFRPGSGGRTLNVLIVAASGSWK
jgi:uncharacterized small protein (DUF1192 family)